MNRILMQLAVLLGLTSCTFSPEGVFFQEIPQPDTSAPTLTMVTELPEAGIYYDQSVVFTVAGLGNRRILEVNMVFEQEQHRIVENLEDNDFGFHIDPINHTEGVKTLYISLLTTSGSNSLLDNLEGEVIEYQYTVPIRIDRSPPKPVEIFDIRFENGQAHIYFDYSDASKVHFYEPYKLGLYTLDNPDDHKYTRWWDFTHPKHNTANGIWIDSSYVGGPVIYTLSTYYGYNEIGGSFAPFFFNSVSINDVEANVQDGNKAVITWKVSPDFINQHLVLYVQREGDNAPFFTSTDLTVTSTTYPVALEMGQSYKYEVGLRPIEQQEVNEFFSIISNEIQL